MAELQVRSDAFRLDVSASVERAEYRVRETAAVRVRVRRPDGSASPGFGVDECVYVNGNELRYPVEWLKRGTDVSSLSGQPVQLVIRMRGAQLFALQFIP